MTSKLQYIALIGVALCLTGCPEIKIIDLSIQNNRIATDGFTLTGTVEVYQTEPDYSQNVIDDQGKQVGNRGVIAFWMPDEWTISKARISLPGSPQFIPLTPIVHPMEELPKTFPYTRGAWWIFVPECQYPPLGKTRYFVEVDIHCSGNLRKASIGATVSYYDAKKLDTHQITELHVDLETKQASLINEAPKQAQGVSQSAPLPDTCPVMTPVSPVQPGPRNGRCGIVDLISPPQTQGLLPFLIGAIFGF